MTVSLVATHEQQFTLSLYYVNDEPPRLLQRSKQISVASCYLSTREANPTQGTQDIKVVADILLGTSGTSVLLFELLRQHLRGNRLHNNEEVEITALECLQL